MKIKEALDLLNIPAQWARTKGAGVKAAIIDHPCIASRVPFVRAVNYDPAMDGHWHGSVVAWIINQVAPEAEVYSLKGLQGWNLAKCLNWCVDNGVHVVNMSLYVPECQEARDALQRALDAGIILVAAAGNNGYDEDDNDSEVVFPGDYPGVVTVGDLWRVDTVAGDSSGGPEVKVVAPGSIDIPWPPWVAGGTSFSSPLIAGVLALVKSACPWTTPKQAQEFVEANCRDILETGKDDRSGYGVFRFPDEWEIPKEEPKVLRPFVVINPGHMPGQDNGACANGLQEANIVTDLTNLIAPGLAAYGIGYAIVRSNSLQEICDLANAYGDDVLFLSLHVNAGGGTGYEDFIYNAESDASMYRDLLRIEVMNYLAPYKTIDRGKKYSNLAVLRDTVMPAVLCENLFIDHMQDVAMLKNPDFIKGLAGAYVKGIARALGQSLKPQAEADVPEWAREGIMWGVANGLIDTQEGSDDWYRFMTVLKRYDKLRFG